MKMKYFILTTLLLFTSSSYSMIVALEEVLGVILGLTKKAASTLGSIALKAGEKKVTSIIEQTYTNVLKSIAGIGGTHYFVANMTDKDFDVELGLACSGAATISNPVKTVRAGEAIDFWDSKQFCSVDAVKVYPVGSDTAYEPGTVSFDKNVLNSTSYAMFLISPGSDPDTIAVSAAIKDKDGTVQGVDPVV